MESIGLFHNNFDKMYQGSFSYKNNNSNTVMIDHNNKAILENIDQTIARIYFVNNGRNHIQIPNNMTLREVRRKVVESGRSTEWCTMPKLCCVHCTHMSKKIIFIVHHNLSLLMFEMCGVWLFYTQLY